LWRNPLSTKNPPVVVGGDELEEIDGETAFADPAEDFHLEVHLAVVNGKDLDGEIGNPILDSDGIRDD
jgi:hypothetical protein